MTHNIHRRTLVGDPFVAADLLLQLRRDVADAGIEWVLAKREAVSAQARFNAVCPEVMQTFIDVDPALQHAAARFLDASKREHDAMQRWKAAATALVEALERRAP